MPLPRLLPAALASTALLFLAGVGSAADPTVTRIDLESKSILPCARWADEKGKEAYLLDGDKGLLYKVAIPDGKVVSKKDFGRKVGWLDESGAGLIVSVPDKGELWVLGADLETKKTITVPDIGQAASSPKLPFALVGGVKDSVPLRTVDLKTGKATAIAVPAKFGRTLGGNPVVSPDGASAFTEEGETTIRFTIPKKGMPTPVESIRSGGNAQRIHVSPDSKLVARPSGGGNPDLGGSYRTGVFSTGGLTKKECVLESGGYPVAVGFDPVAKKIYTQNADFQLLAYNTGGVKKGEYKFGKESPHQFLAHPSGNKVLVIAKDQISFVELPKDE
jgi:hypothetical protein